MTLDELFQLPPYALAKEEKEAALATIRSENSGARPELAACSGTDTTAFGNFQE
ncbi:hypothetical protein [uncultured Mailhella sp.]|uniref:hypothetical protein n=1 Tax=uncultured Mailhella sp. TaxID=1981031 RepID=UPI00263013E2|nr:hypothetical protein [uncultured Mailhella sp.]